MNNILISKSLNYIKDVKKKKVIVIGDILLDKYTYGKVSSVSTGIKLPIIEKHKTIYNLGGASNVAANLADFYNETYLLGIIGNDYYASIVDSLCQKNGVMLLSQKLDNTNLKERIYIDTQQVMRLDNNIKTCSYDSDLLNTYLYQKNPDIVVVVDYLYGCIDQKVIDIIQNYCISNNKSIIVHSRDLSRYKISEETVLFLNKEEYSTYKYSLNISDQDITNRRIITEGANGVTYIDCYKNIHQEQFLVNPINVSGAGDSVLATASIIECCGKFDFDELILLNEVGALAVQSKETYILNKKDLISKVLMSVHKDESCRKLCSLDQLKVVLSYLDATKINLLVIEKNILAQLNHLERYLKSRKFNILLIQKNNEYSRIESEIIKLLALIDSINIIVYSESIECKKWLENISLHNNIKIRYIG
jgi:rfaE bifunctional protein